MVSYRTLMFSNWLLIHNSWAMLCRFKVLKDFGFVASRVDLGPEGLQGSSQGEEGGASLSEAKSL